MAYCTADEIASVLSEQGISYATDDDRSGGDSGLEEAFVADAIERAEARVNQYLMQWYDLATLAGNKWIKWCTATFAAMYLMRRRGDAAPNGLVVQAEEWEAHLQAVQAGQGLIPVGAADAGTAQLLVQSAGLTMSNLKVDQRFWNKKIRYVPYTSTGPAGSKLPRNPDYRSTYTWE